MDVSWIYENVSWIYRGVRTVYDRVNMNRRVTCAKYD